MMQIVLSQVRNHIRDLPREAKVEIIQRYVLPECDLEDLAALQELIRIEILRRRGRHHELIGRIEEALR